MQPGGNAASSYSDIGTMFCPYLKPFLSALDHTEGGKLSKPTNNLTRPKKTPFIKAVAPNISLWQVCHTRFFHKLSLYLYHLPLGCTLSSFFTSSPSLSSVLTSSGAWSSMQVRTSIICINLSYHVFSSNAMRSSKDMEPALLSWCPLQICKLNMLHHKSVL